MSLRSCASLHLTEKKPAYMCVIIGHMDAVMTDPETGIYITPLTSLRP